MARLGKLRPLRAFRNRAYGEDVGQSRAPRLLYDKACDGGAARMCCFLKHLLESRWMKKGGLEHRLRNLLNKFWLNLTER